MFKLFKNLAQKNRLTGWSAGLIAFLPGIVLLLIHQVLLKANIYYAIADLDILMHLVGGACVAWAALALYGYGVQSKKLPQLPVPVLIILAVGAAAIIGILWEFYEFLHDAFFSTDYQLAAETGIADTMKDFADDLIGAILLSYVSARLLFRRIK